MIAPHAWREVTAWINPIENLSVPTVFDSFSPDYGMFDTLSDSMNSIRKSISSIIEIPEVDNCLPWR